MTRKTIKQRISEMDSFTHGYMTAMIWTECNPDNLSLKHKTEKDLSHQALDTIFEDCKDFQESNKVYLDQTGIHSPLYSEEDAGHDFWLTRNGHGAGFWDRGLGTIGQELTKNSHAYGEQHLYVGFSSRLYI